MTERKSTEIKIRVTPSFKARVQGAADAAGVSLTEWLEGASEERVAATSLSGGAGAPCKDCGQHLPPHTSHCGTCVQGFPMSFHDTALASRPYNPAKSWMYEGKGG